jgi:hypothetical protein
MNVALKPGAALRHRSTVSAQPFWRKNFRILKMFLGGSALAMLVACAAVTPSKDLLAGMNARGPAKTILQLDLKSSPALPPGEKGVDADFDGSGDALHLNGYDSYYRIFRIDPSQGKLKFVVRAYCRCLGFDKRQLVPVLRFITDTGEIIDPSDTRYSLVQAENFTPMSLKLRAFVPGNNIRYVVVAADNSQPDAVVQGLNFDAGLHLDVRSYPLGKFNLTYQSL